MMTTKTRSRGNAPGLPAVPLPGRVDALSRRRAIFGAVAAAAAPGAALGTAKELARDIPPADARLAALADELHALDATCNAHVALHRGRETDATEAEFDALNAGYAPRETEMADTAARSIRGLLAKARVLQIRCVRDTADAHGMALSIADDLVRLAAAGRFA